jgi:hypothetical protein
MSLLFTGSAGGSPAASAKRERDVLHDRYVED